MRVRAEFTTEPFHGEGEPPPHALAALEIVRAAGLSPDFGPLGTGVAGEAEAVIAALGEVLRAALSQGATRVTVQVETDPADV